MDSFQQSTAVAPWAKGTFAGMRSRSVLTALATSMLMVCAQQAGAQLRLNEACSRNVSVLLSPEGEPEDWIELLNNSGAAINLHDFYLTDKADEPGQWRLPEIMLESGEFIVLMHGEAPDRFPFGIDNDGETLVLSDALLQPLQVLDVPRLRSDHSTGFAGSDLRLFDSPTPGSPNSTTAYFGYAPDPVLAPPPGFYDTGVQVSAYTSAGTVHWTTNGRAPDASAPVASTLLSIDTVTTVLACTHAPGWLPSDVTSGTYFIGVDRALPIVALAVDPDSMFHDSLGLYMPGPNADPAWPHYGANYWSERELPARMEFYETSGARGIAQDVGVKIHGGRRSRTNPQRPLRLTAREELGQATIQYPMFPERPAVSEYKRLILRNAGGDFCIANFRDALFHQTSFNNHLDIDALGFRPAECYINGRYWGLVEIRERIDEDHLHYNYGADRSELLLMEEENWSIQGDTIHAWALREFIRTADMSDDANWQHVEDQLDLHSLTDYFATEMIAGNVDWPSNNVKYWKPSISDGKWRYLMYDLDATMVLYPWIEEDIDMMYWTFTHRAGSFHTELLRGLMGRQEFKRLFLNRKADLMNTVFSPDRFQAEVDRVTTAFAPVIQDHYERWGCWYQEYLNNAFGVIPHFVAHRTSHVLQHVTDWYGFPNAARLHFEAFPPGGGRVRINTITPELPFDGWYWNGNAIDVTAEPAEGFVFSHWSYADEPEQPGTAHLQRSFPVDGPLVAHFHPLDGHAIVFPNPTDGILTVGVEALDPGNAWLSVTDAAGRLVMELRPAVRPGTNRVIIDLSALMPGVYILKVEAGGTMRTSRVVRH